jgi:toxin-antitoxin system PIN domain toxin
LKRWLFDVNVLIAILDTDHVHHDRVSSWLLAQPAAGWASCPLTQNGCVRVMSQAGYPNPLPVPVVMERLGRATLHPSHRFWAADISLLDDSVTDRSRIHGPRQLTDLYLLALAVKNDGCFTTFDATIPLSAIRGATPAHLVVI